MKLSTISSKNKIPQTVSEIKQPKPKIKLLMEKDTLVEETVKAILPSKNLEMYNSTQVRKSSSSFFKPIEKILEEKKEEDEDALDLKPVTLYNDRRKSAVNFGNNFAITSQDKKDIKHKKYQLDSLRKSVSVLKL